MVTIGELYRSRRAPGDLGSLVLGALAVTAFSLTLPLTRAASAYLDPVFVAFARAAVAGIAAVALLVRERAPLPSARQLQQLVVIAAGVVFGFPIAAGWAMGRVAASHGGIVVGILPLVTAYVGSRIAPERIGARFWIASAVGSAAVITFAIRSGGGALSAADLALLVATLAAAVGYAFSGRLARELGGARVIAWALVLALPISVPVSAVYLRTGIPSAPLGIWASFAYLALVSQLGAFFLWNHALAVGGIARVSQTQLLQPFLTVLAASVLLGERLPPSTLVFALIVVGSVAMGRSAIGAPSNTLLLPSKGTSP